jgi:hypothetical protein
VPVLSAVVERLAAAGVESVVPQPGCAPTAGPSAAARAVSHVAIAATAHPAHHHRVGAAQPPGGVMFTVRQRGAAGWLFTGELGIAASRDSV